MLAYISGSIFCFHYFYSINQNTMRKNFLFFIVAFSFLQLSAQKTYIWCGSLIDGISNEAKKNMTIVIEKNKIIAVENGFSQPGANDKSIDLKTKTITPGWIDCHVHLSHETNPNRYLEAFQLN